MALAGINNVSVLETPYLGENYSSVSLTRTSIIRKMWRDLESENRTRETERQQTGGMADGNTGSQCSCSLEGAESEDVSVNTSEAENECPRDQNQMEIQSGQEDNGNLCIQRSPAIGVADKERVRQVFREWASKNGSGRAALNVSHKTNGSRAQSPCENECKRVRAVRQWIESNPQQEETGRPVIEEQAPETGCQVEQICGGLGVDHTRVGVRRPVRGRQAFLDLLARFETERAKEMQILLESQLVSNFSHRNRIQALFRGRFLRNQSFVQDEKPTSTATTELGLLRQSNTVSDLRKGFLSGSDDDEQTHDGPQSETSSDNGIKDHQENFQQLLGDIVSGFETISTQSNAKTHGSPGVFYAPVQESHERVLVNEVGPQPPSQIIENRDLGQDQDILLEINHGDHQVETSQRTLKPENPTHAQFQPKACGSPREYAIPVEERHERGLENELGQQPPPIEIIENKDPDQDRDQNVLVECNYRAPHIEPSEQTLELESAAQGQYQFTGEELQVNEAFDRLNHSETSRGILACQVVLVETEEGHEPIIEENDSEWNNLTNTEVKNGSYAKSTENENESVEERHEGLLENEVGQQPPPAEVTENRDQDQDGSVERSQDAYHIEPSQRTLELDIPERGQYQLNREELEVNESLDHHSETLSWREGSVETEVWQEPTIEDNGSEWEQLTNTEIFEGSDANSVGNEDEWYRETAGNDFQESLENWCGVGTSYQEAPLVVTTDVFYTSDDDNGNRPELRELMSRRRVSNLLQSDFRVRLDQVVQSYVERQDQAFESDDEWMLDQEQQHLDQPSVDESEDATETVEISEVAYPVIHQHSGAEWEIINGLRFDMVKLQERMNSMQNTLETCISMQLELQRSMQQEVSSALNRLSTSGESSLQTCFLCCDNNIHDDSSPDRCGHVYVCSNCAEKVNWSKLKESVRHP